jgi:hypothetical protein
LYQFVKQIIVLCFLYDGQSVRVFSLLMCFFVINNVKQKHWYLFNNMDLIYSVERSSDECLDNTCISNTSRIFLDNFVSNFSGTDTISLDKLKTIVYTSASSNKTVNITTAKQNNTNVFMLLAVKSYLFSNSMVFNRK